MKEFVLRLTLDPIAAPDKHEPHVSKQLTPIYVAQSTFN
jgi:hypothetical protein